MTNKILLITLLSSILSLKAFSVETNDKVSEEIKNLQKEFNNLSDEANQKLQLDSNYSEKIKLKVSEKINQIKIKDEDIEKILNDTNVSEEKKGRAVKELKKINKSLKKKLQKESN